MKKQSLVVLFAIERSALMGVTLMGVTLLIVDW